MNILLLENKYLLAKSFYYNGSPIMSDAEFDTLEKYLTDNGSNVVKQVGTKVKDFDFFHPTPMLSLSKIQIERRIDDTTNYMVDEFNKWINKKSNVIGIKIDDLSLEATNKWDGNAINIIYTTDGLQNVLTRGDGELGNDVTDRISLLIPSKIDAIELNDNDILEIRCEVVIKKSIFETKYSKLYENPRNYVAGVLNKDDIDINKVKELTIKPIHYILNGIHISPSYFDNCDVFKYSCEIFKISQYETIIKKYEKNRESNEFQLDGVVIALPIQYRSELGCNNHDPEWSVAIKFLSEIVTTSVVGLDLKVGKNGELAPVALLAPVRLMGSTVRRASIYNIGYIIEKQLGIGSIISIRKAGDIIPQLVNVIVPANEQFHIIDVCPACGSKLYIEDIHLICKNVNCGGRKKRQYESALGKIKIKGIGGQTLARFTEFNDLIDIIVWVRENGNTTEIEKYGITYGSKTHENFVKAFNNIYEISLSNLISALGYAGVGDSISTQISKMYSGCHYDFKGLTKELVAMFEKPEMKELIFNKKKQLEDVGITIKMETDMSNENSIFVVLTGSPKPQYKTKEDFLLAHPNLVDVGKLTDKRCNLLITDDMNSMSSKMLDATKKGILIKTYGDF